MFSSNQHVLKFQLLHEISSWFLAFWLIIRFYRFAIFFLIFLILLVVSSIWGTSVAILLCFDRWIWRRKKNWNVEKSIINEKKWWLIWFVWRAWNDRSKWPFIETLKWSFAETLKWFFAVACVTIWRWSDRIADNWCIFFKKTWSNKCVWRPINGLSMT